MSDKTPLPPSTMPGALPSGEQVVEIREGTVEFDDLGRPARGPMNDETLNAIARGVVSGLPISTVAAGCGRSESAVRRAVSSNPELRKRIESVRSTVMRGVIAHHYEMLAMLPEARAAISGGIHSQDETTRLSTSKWLIETVVPPQPQRLEHEHAFVDSEGAQIVGAALTGIASSMKELADAQRDRPSALDRVRSGPDALPRPTPLPANPNPPPPGAACADASAAGATKAPDGGGGNGSAPGSSPLDPAA